MAQTIVLETCDNPRSVRPRPEFVAYGKLLGAPKVIETPREGDEYFDHGTLLHTMEVPKALTRGKGLELLKDAIHNTFSTSGCWHSHDCCGCPVNSALTYRLRVVRPGQVMFPVSYGSNY